MSFYEMFTNPFVTKIIMRALVVGVLVSLCAALLGVSLVLKRYSMIGDGLSHVGFGAMSLAPLLALLPGAAFLADYSLEISIPVVIIAAFLLLRLSDRSKLNGDSAIAVVSTGAMAVGVIIYNFTTGITSDICSSLFSSASVVTITDKDMYLSVGLSVAVVAMFIFFYNRIFAVTFDETFSEATGGSPRGCKMMIALLTAVTVVLGIRMMGAIMISAVVVFPALTAMRVCKSFKSVIVFAALLSVADFLIGFFVACRFSFQTGPAVVLVNLVAFLVFSLVASLRAHGKPEYNALKA